jgi:hypothetical protein
MPIIRSLRTAAAASGLPLERDGSSTIGRLTTANSTAGKFLNLVLEKDGKDQLD